jgi:crossover junction endodeoxyribonuclease RuvC
MRIIGIDISISNTGIAITDKDNYIFSSTIKTNHKEKIEHRVLKIYRNLSQILENYKPEIAIIESTIYYKNPKTAILLGCARGVVLLALSEKKIKIVDISPTSIKLAVAGTGVAKKHQIQFMIRALFKLNCFLNEHESDALALIYTYLNREENDIRHKR